MNWNNAGLLGLAFFAVIWLLAALEQRHHLKKTRKKSKESGGKYIRASPPIQQIGNFRNSQGSGYEDIAMRDKNDEE